MKSIDQRLLHLLICRECNCPLNFTDAAFECEQCGVTFPVRGGIADFLDQEAKDLCISANPNDLKFQEEQMLNSSITAKLYNIGSSIISCDYTPFDQLERFVDDIDKNAIFVELGSGNRHLRGDCINLDIFPFKNVDILTDVKKTPFSDNTVDFAVIDAVLEHVPEPHAVVNEIYRIMKPGGSVFCVVPFIHPYHGYPKNYFNISKDGLSYLFRHFSRCEIGSYRGPTSAIINLIAEYVVIAFSGNEKGFMYTMLRAGALFPIFLLKYLDRLWNPKGGSLRISNALYAIVTK